MILHPVWHWFATLDYGTVPAWLGAVGTTCAFAATSYVIARDANLRRGAQARRIACHVSCKDGLAEDGITKTYECAYTVTNLSDEPIYMIAVLPVVHELGYFTLGGRILLPTKTWERTIGGARPYTEFHLQFTDNAGNIWWRTHDDRLQPARVSRKERRQQQRLADAGIK
jgi:hypothetical protein